MNQSEKTAPVTECQHCFHAKVGPVWQVVPDGHVVMECCKCHTTHVVHKEHVQRLDVARG